VEPRPRFIRPLIGGAAVHRRRPGRQQQPSRCAFAAIAAKRGPMIHDASTTFTIPSPSTSGQRASHARTIGTSPMRGRAAKAFAVLGFLAAGSCAQSTSAVHAQDASAHAAKSSASTNDTSIRPFHFRASEAALADLKQRLAATRWPEKETVPDDSQGVQLATIKAVVDYWQSEYDWRKVEAKLNALPQFVTTIDGLDIHFIHVRSKQQGALPVIITHGWPGSVIELLKVIEPLTNPTAHGGKPEDAFDVVIPSIPGYGFSGIPKDAGWGPARIANAWVELMKRLGYTRYVAQGGDWGAVITDVMAAQKPEGLLGMHSNMAGTVPPDIDKALRDGARAPAALSADERRAYGQLASVYQHVAYAIQMWSRPQSLTGLEDSPAGLAAWLLDHDVLSQQQIANLFVAKKPFGDITRDDILDNVTLYWLTKTGVSSSRLYWENKSGQFFDPKNVTIPAAVSVFPGELFESPRSWTERAYPNLIYFHHLDQGGHFAAWEQPELFTKEVRAAFQSLR
jgi:pimeloyl-ACP methyl ester carboxylesterase